jgi:osmotically-inducible protein OsmY
MKRGDAQILEDVLLSLQEDQRVHQERIGVSVVDGVVKLSGIVPSFAEKAAVEEAARRIDGVSAIVEEIKVHLPGVVQRDDQTIAEDVATKLKWNLLIPHRNIKVSVEAGMVSLAGDVQWKFQRKAAERSVLSIKGVRGLEDKISVLSGASS